MSKWINNDLFGEFQKQKKIEKENPRQSGGVRRSELVWKTPEKGSETTAKTYTGRFLSDPKGVFYKEYFYHMYRAGDKWVFVICPKTEGFDNYCPFCSVTSKLYLGTASDKKMAYTYKRKSKFVGNFFISDDPRDTDREEENKVNGTVKLYEFPGKVEMKLKEEITDQENGLGASIFDPSSEGYNFILKILATRRDANGDQWPDYSTSSFSRRAEAIGTDEEIDGYMENCLDISEYIKSMAKEEEELVKLVKDEMLMDLILDEYNQLQAKRARESGGDQNPEQEQESAPEQETAAPTDAEVPADDFDAGTTSQDDEDLLRELEGM